MNIWDDDAWDKNMDVNLKVPEKEFKDLRKYVEITLAPSCGFCGIRKQECKICSRCKMIRYCSKDCQVNGFSKHKKHCVKIEKIQKEMIKEEANPPIFSQQKTLFTYSVRYGFKVRGKLAVEMMRSARLEGNDFAYEVALEHFFVLVNRQNFDEDYKQEIFNVLTFALISLGHFQRAYDLLKSWMIQRHKDLAKKWKTFGGCKKFDNDMTENLLVSCNQNPSQTGEVLALLLLKIILIRRIEDGDVQIAHTQMDKEVQSIVQNGSPFVDFLVDVNARKCRLEQEKLAFELVRVIINKCQNKLILQALCNPTELMQVPLTSYVENDSCCFEQARILVEVALDAFQRNRAISFIKEILGDDIAYTVEN